MMTYACQCKNKTLNEVEVVALATYKQGCQIKSKKGHGDVTKRLQTKLKLLHWQPDNQGCQTHV